MSSVALNKTHSAPLPEHSSRSLPLADPEDQYIELRPLQRIVTRPFAGRIGANQPFAVAPENPEYNEVLKKTPDAAPQLSWKESFDLRPLKELELWKQAVFEAWATAMFVFLQGLVMVGLDPVVNETSTGPLLPSIIGTICLMLQLALFIYAGGPVSGGHFNPLITISTFFGRLATFPRMVLYVTFQLMGAVIGGFLVRAGINVPLTEISAIPGCTITPALVTPGQAYVLETISALSLVYLAFGVGLDPRQKFGPSVGPMAVGISTGLVAFTSSFLMKGYTGAYITPVLFILAIHLKPSRVNTQLDFESLALITGGQ